MTDPDPAPKAAIISDFLHQRGAAPASRRGESRQERRSHGFIAAFVYNRASLSRM
jgi:hypothetical protein